MGSYQGRSGESKRMRSAWAFCCVLAALTSCAHQQTKTVLTTQPTPAPSMPVKPPESPPAPKIQEEPSQALSMQIMAGNIEPLQGEDPTLPEEVLSVSHGQTLEGSYKMCIAADGTVLSVTPVAKIDGADQCIMDALKAWRFPKVPLVVCKLQTLRFEVP